MFDIGKLLRIGGKLFTVKGLLEYYTYVEYLLETEDGTMFWLELVKHGAFRLWQESENFIGPSVVSAILDRYKRGERLINFVVDGCAVKEQTLTCIVKAHGETQGSDEGDEVLCVEGPCENPKEGFYRFAIEETNGKDMTLYRGKDVEVEEV